MGIESIRGRALQALRPPAELPTAEWIERNIFLPQTASALPGKMKLWAYQRGICEAVDDPGIERVPTTPQDREHVRPIEGLAPDRNPLRPLPHPVPLGLRAGSHGHLLVMRLEPRRFHFILKHIRQHESSSRIPSG